MKKPPVTGGLPSAVCALVLACTLASSCTPAGDAPPLAVERDSAGITIVESFTPAWGDSARWRVGAEPLLDLAESLDLRHIFSD